MGNCVTDWVFRRQRFCCCLPARLGAAVLALLTLILSGLLAIILWLEVASGDFMEGKEKTAFILAGILETFLFVASVLGFIGTCARKQLFVAVFATFLYIHFFINLGVAAYFLWMITRTANKDIVALCEQGIRNEQGQDQCRGLLKVTKGVYWGVSLLVLTVEAYCALIVTRYLNQLRYEKRDVRQSRLNAKQSAYEAYHARFSSIGSGISETQPKHHSALSDLEADKEGLLNAPRVEPFDPYEAVYDPHRRSYPDTPTLSPAPPGRNRTPSDEGANKEYHRNVAEAQLTSRGVSADTEMNTEQLQQEGGRDRTGSMLPPGAAPAVQPTSGSRESSLAPSLPPPYKV